MRCIRPRMWAVVNGKSCIAPYRVTRSSSLLTLLRARGPYVGRLVPATGRADTASSRPVSARATEATTIRLAP